MLDNLDFRILEALMDDGRIKFKHLAKQVHSDERKISRRVDRLIKMGIIKKFTVEIDWNKLGLNTEAYVGTRTAVDADVRKKLFNFFETEPRIIRVDSTVGAYEYLFHTISIDLHDFRDKIGTPLEPLTAGLSSSIISKNIKPPNYKSLFKIVKSLMKSK